jgi:hypothetical protein
MMELGYNKNLVIAEKRKGGKNEFISRKTRENEKSK